MAHAAHETRCAVKWYQLHLSTCCILSVLAGVVVFLNVREHPSGEFAWIDISTPAQREIEWQEARGRGWPSAFEYWHKLPGEYRYQWDWNALALDAFFCVVLLGLAAAGIERGMRRVRSRGTSPRP
jgi:hypothetical protein